MVSIDLSIESWMFWMFILILNDSDISIKKQYKSKEIIENIILSFPSASFEL